MSYNSITLWEENKHKQVETQQLTENTLELSTSITHISASANTTTNDLPYLNIIELQQPKKKNIKVRYTKWEFIKKILLNIM
jgi:hypothetical protein